MSIRKLLDKFCANKKDLTIEELDKLMAAKLIGRDAHSHYVTSAGAILVGRVPARFAEDSDHSQCPDDDSYLPPPNKARDLQGVLDTYRGPVGGVKAEKPTTIELLRLPKKVLNEQARSAIDMVNQPPHYTAGGIECIDAIRAALTPEEFRGFCKGNAIKYSWREKLKGGDEDLKKAAWYLAKVTA
jgi:hypothetical protein